MSRKSRAISKGGGSEIEWGIKSSDARQGPGDAAWEFVSRIRPAWLSGGSFSLWDSRPRLAGEKDGEHGYFVEPEWRKANILLPNGARLYVDGAHPEFSTAFCRTPKEKLAHYRAADLIMRYLVKRHREEGRDFTLFKNNYGFDDLGFRGAFRDVSPQAFADYAVSFSHHDNYLMRRDVSWNDCIQRTIPWLVLRQIFNGQGKVGSHNRLVTGLGWCDFQISQRADFFSKLSGIDTMGIDNSFPTKSFRPIFNTRDVPYADSRLYRRLHMIAADENMCETAYFLTVGLTAIHFMMLEDGFLDDRFVLTDPVQAFWQISRDLAFQEGVSLENRGEPRLPLELLEEYVELMGEYLLLYDIRESEYHEAVALGLEIIGKLRDDPEECVGELDYITKKVFIEGRIEQGKVPSFCSHEAIQLDLNYAKINPAHSIFSHRVVQEQHRRIITDADIEAAVSGPPPTRSALQVAVHRLFEPHVHEWHWSETSVWVPEEGAYYTIDFGNPRMTEAEYAPLLAGADRLEFLRRACAAGIAKKCGGGYAKSASAYYPEQDE